MSSINDPKLKVVQRYTSRARRTGPTGSCARAKVDRREPAGRPEQRGPEDLPQLRRRGRTRRSAACPAAGRSFAGQRDDPFFVDLGATFDVDPPPQRDRERRRRQGRPGGLQRPLDRAPGARSPRSPATGRSVSGPERGQRRRRRVVEHRAAAAPGQRTELRDRLRRGEAARPSCVRAGRAGQPPRQPAHQRGGHPARAEGQVQRHPAGQRRRQLRRVRASSPSWRT